MLIFFFFFLMFPPPPNSTLGRSSAASDVYKGREGEVARVYWKSGGVGGTGDGEGGWIDEKGVIGDVQP